MMKSKKLRFEIEDEERELAIGLGFYLEMEEIADEPDPIADSLTEDSSEGLGILKWGEIERGRKRVGFCERGQGFF